MKRRLTKQSPQTRRFDHHSLAAVMEKNMAIKILNLAGNFISDDGAYRIGEMLKNNKHLVDLNLEFHAKKRPYRDKDKPYPR